MVDDVLTDLLLRESMLLASVRKTKTTPVTEITDGKELVFSFPGDLFMQHGNQILYVSRGYLNATDTKFTGIKTISPEGIEVDRVFNVDPGPDGRLQILLSYISQKSLNLGMLLYDPSSRRAELMDLAPVSYEVKDARSFAMNGALNVAYTDITDRIHIAHEGHAKQVATGTQVGIFGYHLIWALDRRLIAQRLNGLMPNKWDGAISDCDMFSISPDGKALAVIDKKEGRMNVIRSDLEVIFQNNTGPDILTGQQTRMISRLRPNYGSDMPFRTYDISPGIAPLWTQEGIIYTDAASKIRWGEKAHGFSNNAIPVAMQYSNGFLVVECCQGNFWKTVFLINKDGSSVCKLGEPRQYKLIKC